IGAGTWPEVSRTFRASLATQPGKQLSPRSCPLAAVVQEVERNYLAQDKDQDCVDVKQILVESGLGSGAVTERDVAHFSAVLLYHVLQGHCLLPQLAPEYFLDYIFHAFQNESENITAAGTFTSTLFAVQASLCREAISGPENYCGVLSHSG
ncbi:zinc transporter ZIP4-like, partial [Callorhinchus milii]|uniref:zinc transporter ZIP4-like n=1 Tax=Callorhinchus milii TaxID=7868 RepID=UPI001C3FF000